MQNTWGNIAPLTEADPKGEPINQTRDGFWIVWDSIIDGFMLMRWTDERNAFCEVCKEGKSGSFLEYTYPDEDAPSQRQCEGCIYGHGD